MKNLSKKLLAIFLTTILSLNFSLPVFATNTDEKTLDMNDRENIFYYDSKGDVCVPTTSEISSSDVYIIGDSITVGSEDEIKQELKNATIDAAVSRQFSAGLDILRKQDQDSLKRVVVLALGTNGNIASSDIDEALSIVGQERTLILVTNYKLGNESAYNANNSLIKNTAESNKNVKIADWAAAVKENPEKYITNADGLGVHPTEDGQKLFAETIINAVKESSNTGSSTNSAGDNKLYNGSPAFSDDSMQKINENKPFYEKSANKYNIPWQIIAVLHYRETGLKRYNPANGQGVYQLYSYTNSGNAFLPAGDISDDEFQRQTDIVAKLIKENYGAGLDLGSDDNVKLFFFKYNGTANAYIAQARDLGFSEAEANRGEGSPYVMNLADEKRDSSKNPNWRQITTDGGGLSGPANSHPGAYVLYAALGGGTGSSSCKNSNSGNGDLNQTAINLAWPDYGHGLTARDTYKTALSEIGLSNYGDHFANIGASCDAFVATVFRASGVDPDFKCCGVSNGGATWSYVTNSGKFEEVPNNAGSLKPGDIRLSSGHIELYVEVEGVGKIASASYGERTGEIGPFYENAGTFKAYRWKGN